MYRADSEHIERDQTGRSTHIYDAGSSTAVALDLSAGAITVPRMTNLIDVDGTGDDRWQVGLDLLRAGEGGMRLPGVVITRHDAPPADSSVHILFGSRFAAVRTTAASARGDVARASQLIQAAIENDHQLKSVLDEFGVVWQFVEDVRDRGSGAILATINEDGFLNWFHPEPPSP